MACQGAKAKGKNNKNQQQNTGSTTIDTKGIKSGKVQKPGNIPEFNFNQKILLKTYQLKM